jgi:hypothetical protein
VFCCGFKLGLGEMGWVEELATDADSKSGGGAERRMFNLSCECCV